MKMTNNDHIVCNSWHIPQARYCVLIDTLKHFNNTSIKGSIPSSKISVCGRETDNL